MVMKLKRINLDETQKSQNVMKLKNSNCDETKNSNSEELKKI